MRQDQYERLAQLEEGLMDVFIKEASPEKWPGAGLDPATMSKDARGDQYWCKKNAFATLSLVQRIGTLIGQVQAQGAGPLLPPSGEAADGAEAADLETEVASAEREAKKLFAALGRRDNT